MNDIEKTTAQVDSPSGRSTASRGARDAPVQIGRYRIERVLGEGGFGRVYLAHDDQLQRPVAIKVPHARLMANASDTDAYLTEARTVATLDHPHIVPVYDVGSTDEHPCFVVSKYIDGTDLAARLRQSRPSFTETVNLVATVAEALHHAHKQGLVHRDIKPANLLLDKSGHPFVADFGLALREQDVGKGLRHAGTPAYMSPEQARGEGHRVDGRSDVFSLGVVFYEMLVGRKPFLADSVTELLEAVSSHEPRPLRQVDETVPRELERICFKALSKKASERYSTAKDLAEDLRHFLTQAPVSAKLATTHIRSDSAVVPAAPPLSDSQPVRIVPKGLRSFDAHDADYFLELLAGPRDRDDLPDSLRFWKTRIEETDAESTFAVGLIYGPSGCGKSSLVKAGLLPRLAKSVLSVYVEAAGGETEARLLNGLRKRCPSLAADLGLKESLAALRRGQGLPPGVKKVLIVLDQFEQWLHAAKDDPNAELLQGLRQCDGGRVQCLLMTRDDFWLAISRFMRDLEIRLVEGQNSSLADLFDVEHARKVLAAFGRAFGRLPETGDLNPEQKQFLSQAVASLAQDGKVISVRLALFAEMMKGKAWTPATLKAVGGAEGVGLTFLEETFIASTAPPEHRYHQKAARSVLQALLPESGSDLKGHMRSYAELLAASGYAERPKDFENLIRLLDSALRLLTPVDPGGQADDAATPMPSSGKYYQLTHDYLVPSLRDWLTRKQKETRRGRAELLLADRAAVWNARPENRQLPSLLQWLSIRRLTKPTARTAPQQKMLRQADRFHSTRLAMVVLLLTVAAVAGVMLRNQIADQRNATHAAGLVEAVLKAETAQVPGLVAEMGPYRLWADPLLKTAHDNAEANSRPKLHASLALLPVDPEQKAALYQRLLEAAPHEVPVIRESLTSHKGELLEPLWVTAESPALSKHSQRLRAACALASYDSENPRWSKVQESVAGDLVQVPAVYSAVWMDSLRPVRQKLLAPLTGVYRNPACPEVERLLATDILADYASDQPSILADLVMDASPTQFARLFPKLKAGGEAGLAPLLTQVATPLPAGANDATKETMAKRQANAAVALVKLKRTDMVWPLLKHSPDPRARSYLIHRLAPFGAEIEVLVRRLKEEPDKSIRRALILSLGEFDVETWQMNLFDQTMHVLEDIYSTDPDPGLHAAAEWLLRRWKRETLLAGLNDNWAKDSEARKKREEAIRSARAKDNGQAQSQWYVTGQGQTMAVIPGPVEFTMGSPESESGRHVNERPHTRRIGRTFALATKHVTVLQFQQFNRQYDDDKLRKERINAKFLEPDLPVVVISWNKAAGYCNWLSESEGIPEAQRCYANEGTDDKPVWIAKDNYLQLTGYRLPTETELEYAARANARTSRHYGETEELLPYYAWYLNNSGERTHPAGALKPNEFGCFDMLGNAFSWCQEANWDYPKPNGPKVFDDVEMATEVDNTVGRMLRGGSWFNQASVSRSANRVNTLPNKPADINSIRPARTIIP